jgi:hypothetical protein
VSPTSPSLAALTSRPHEFGQKLHYPAKRGGLLHSSLHLAIINQTSPARRLATAHTLASQVTMAKKTAEKKGNDKADKGGSSKGKAAKSGGGDDGGKVKGAQSINVRHILVSRRRPTFGGGCLSCRGPSEQSMG